MLSLPMAIPLLGGFSLTTFKGCVSRMTLALEAALHPAHESWIEFPCVYERLATA